jgi:hypothetical protein
METNNTATLEEMEIPDDWNDDWDLWSESLYDNEEWWEQFDKDNYLKELE